MNYSSYAPWYSYYSNIKIVNIAEGVTSIGESAFSDCTSLASITYEDTIEQWNSITKGEDWDSSTGAYTIYCTNGELAK